jgi:hypothetical protein
MQIVPSLGTKMNRFVHPPVVQVEMRRSASQGLFLPALYEETKTVPAWWNVLPHNPFAAIGMPKTLFAL